MNRASMIHAGDAGHRRHFFNDLNRWTTALYFSLDMGTLRGRLR
jgi:hypothetical protein